MIILSSPERILLDVESAVINALGQHFQMQQLRVPIFI